MISDNGIAACAHLIVKQHGGAANVYATGQADHFLKLEDLERYRAWCRVLRRIEGMQQAPNSSASSKDGWDKLQAIGALLSGVFIAGFGIFATITYERESLAVRKSDALTKLLPFIKTEIDDLQSYISLITLAEVTDASFAVHIASKFPGQSGESALAYFQLYGDQKVSKLAFEALNMRKESIVRVKTGSGNLSLSLTIGNTNIGAYKVNIIDEDGKIENAITGSNVDAVPDTLNLGSPADLNGKSISWSIKVLSGDSLPGLYNVRLELVQDGQNLAGWPIEYSGTLEGEKHILGFKQVSLN